MFVNPIWSVLILMVPILIYYLIIRPRLKTTLSDIYTHLPIFQRILKILYAFRTFWVGTFFVILTALPDLLTVVAPVDFSPWLPQPWAAYTGPACSLIIVLLRAFQTTPREEPHG